MPARPKRLCRQPGCPEVTGHKSGFCDDHRSQHQWNHGGKTAHQRGYGANWQRLRMIVLGNQPLCVECERQGRTTLATHVDHILPKAKGGTDRLSNLQSLCEPCHMSKTAKESKR